MLSTREVVEWQDQEVTRVVKQAVREKIDELAEYLSKNAGENPDEDRKMVGGIAAYRHLLEIEFDLTEEE